MGGFAGMIGGMMNSGGGSMGATPTPAAPAPTGWRDQLGSALKTFGNDMTKWDWSMKGPGALGKIPGAPGPIMEASAPKGNPTQAHLNQMLGDKFQVYGAGAGAGPEGS